MIVGRRGTFAILAGAGALALLPRGASAQGLTVEAVLNDPDAPVLGNPQGGLTIVEYFDYQCPFCKAMHQPLTEVVAEDGDIRLVLKDWPIFGAASLRASQLALGAVDLGAYEKAALERAEMAFMKSANAKGRVLESFEILTLTGWKD